MKIGILKEIAEDNRVSMLPEMAASLIKTNNEIFVETGAGDRAFATDNTYEDVGCKVVSREEVLQNADLILSINNINEDVKNKVLMGVFQPLFHIDAIKKHTQNRNTILSLDTIPRTTRAQSMDVLSSQANIAGYKAVLLASVEYGRYFPMFMTAAGSIAPAKMLIIGAGVAGLQAIATAKRLGAVVEVFDTRPAVKEEVQSLGAKFVEVEGAADASKAGGYAVQQSEEYQQKQKQKIAESVAKADIVITTAQIPGMRAPILIDDAMLHSMRNGSVIVDLAAATGGNTSQTKNNETIIYNGVKIIGNSNLPSLQSSDASKLYGKNVINFLKLVIDDKGVFNLNFEDDIVKGTCVAKDGDILNERVKSIA